MIDFGGQYNQLVARRVREANVYCEIYSYRTPLSEIRAMKPKGIILTGGPASCYEPGAASCDPALFSLGIPVLGLCYGAQLMMHLLGGEVRRADHREYGKTALHVDQNSLLFSDVTEDTQCWMSHFDYISGIAEGFHSTATTESCPYAAIEDESRKLYGFQFHPEVLHTPEGSKMLRNFVYRVCGCTGDWRMEDFADREIRAVREKVGNGKVLCALSGGVDSSVASVLLSKAVGKQLTCVFVDHGLLRKDEGDEVEAVFGPKGPYELNFIRVNAAERFYEKLKGVTEPEQKRKIIGEEFIRIFEEEAKKIGAVDFLVQGTIYPDVVESGLGIRIVGEVTAEKVRIVQEADAIYRKEVDAAAKEYAQAHDKTPAPWKPDQYFAALSDMRSVGVMGDERTYDYAVVLRAVRTIDFMTAESAPIPWDLLQKITSRIVNEVRGVNRVLYDLTGKPPATVELE